MGAAASFFNEEVRLRKFLNVEKLDDRALTREHPVRSRSPYSEFRSPARFLVECSALSRCIPLRPALTQVAILTSLVRNVTTVVHTLWDRLDLCMTPERPAAFA
ncbi:hypothetical protein OH77DRAFT_1422138 [Trametes cingulata]|nr:hypothetical protein OH77DRAFT_1422138 [Trametes cingulata]